MPPLRPKVALPKPPTLGTLRSYGLDESDWVRLCRACGCVCVVCGKEFGDRPLAIDHEHVKGFRARKNKRAKKGHMIKVRVMPPEDRRKYVRGVIHNFCNRFIRKWLTVERGRAIVAYLEAFERTRQVG